MASFYGPGWGIKSLKGVIFDKDGTIIDSHIYWGAIIERRAARLAKEMGLSENIRLVLEKVMGYSRENHRLIPEGPIALKSRDEVIEIIVEFLRLNGQSVSSRFVSGVFFDVHKEFLKIAGDYTLLLPGVREKLTELKSIGIPAVIVTSDAKENSEAIIKHLALNDYFLAVIGKEFATEPKETGVLARQACRVMGVQPQEVVAIGDAPADAAMALNAGLKGVILVASGQVAAETLSKYSPNACNSLLEIQIRG